MGGEPSPEEDAEELDRRRAEELLDPLFVAVDAIVYTSLIIAPVGVMMCFGAWWWIACVIGLVVAATTSGRIARRILAALRSWTGR